MILADENLPGAVIDALRAAGFPVERVADVDRGAADVDMLRYASRRCLVIVTQDMDFGDLVLRDSSVHSGVALVRLRGLSFADAADRVLSVFRAQGPALVGSVTVISNTGVRVWEA